MCNVIWSNYKLYTYVLEYIEEVKLSNFQKNYTKMYLVRIKEIFMGLELQSKLKLIFPIDIPKSNLCPISERSMCYSKCLEHF